MTVTTLEIAAPRSFTPPGNRTVRLSHLDPRPLWVEPVPIVSAWRSPTFWAACALVAPLAAVAAPVRVLLRFF